MTSSNTRNPSPFTASQRQELEHHALIFKYMVSGVPIPHDLIYTVKRSLDSAMSSSMFSHQPTVGWGRIQMSYGRKTDPEPGRCRRTDGKKWRCSKEAYPDSKYCERHMHRGRNRSRKPVEITSTTSKTPPTANPLPSTFSTNFFPADSRPKTIITNNSTSPMESKLHTPNLYPFLQPQSSSFRTTYSPESSNIHSLYLDPGSYSEADYRHLQGIREGVDEQALFPLTMNSYKGCSQPQYQRLHDHSKQKQEEAQCFVLGNNLRTRIPITLENENENENENETKQPLHHFFGDWTSKSSDSWLDLASNSTLHTDD